MEVRNCICDNRKCDIDIDIISEALPELPGIRSKARRHDKDQLVTITCPSMREVINKLQEKIGSEGTMNKSEADLCTRVRSSSQWRSVTHEEEAFVLGIIEAFNKSMDSDHAQATDKGTTVSEPSDKGVVDQYGRIRIGKFYPRSQ